MALVLSRQPCCERGERLVRRDGMCRAVPACAGDSSPQSRLRGAVLRALGRECSVGCIDSRVGAADGRAFGCWQVLACAGIARDLSVVRSIPVRNYSHGKCWSAPAPSRTTLPVKRVLAGAQVVFGVSSAEP